MFLIIRGQGCFMIFKCKQTEKCNIFLIWEKCRCLKSKTLVVDGCQVTIWFTVLIQNSIDAQSLEGFKCAATNQTLGQEQSVWIIKWDEVGFIYVEFESLDGPQTNIPTCIINIQTIFYWISWQNIYIVS